MSILLVAEIEKNHIKTSIRQLITAAKQLSQKGDIDLLIVGHSLDSLLDEAKKLPHIRQLWVADHPDLLDENAENTAAVVMSIAQQYTHILTPATAFGKNFLPRVAAKLDVCQVSDVIAIQGPHHFSRPIYAGSLVANIEVEQSIIPMTIRISSFDATEDSALSPMEVKTLPLPSLPNRVKRVKLELTESSRPNLENAKFIVSGGRGLGSQENFEQLLEPLADKLNAALGASRAAVDLGYAPNDYQVGQTGKIVAPQLYLAVGISGAIQHLAGMKNSKCIVAINKDPDAPIFSVADYGLVGDLNQLIPELIEKL